MKKLYGGVLSTTLLMVLVLGYYVTKNPIRESYLASPRTFNLTKPLDGIIFWSLKFYQDEFDEMLSQGFTYQNYDVYRYLPPELQVVLISETLQNEIPEITSKFMTDPVRILVKRDGLTLDAGLFS